MRPSSVHLHVQAERLLQDLQDLLRRDGLLRARVAPFGAILSQLNKPLAAKPQAAQVKAIAGQTVASAIRPPDLSANRAPGASIPPGRGAWSLKAPP